MDNNIERRSFVTLSIYSRTLSAEELAQLVPFPPDTAKQKGTPRGRKPGNVHPHSVVTYESHVDPSADLSAHLEDLLGRLDPAKDALRAFAQRAHGEDSPSTSVAKRPPAPMVLWLRAETTDGAIGFGVSHQELEAICDLGAYLAVELETYDEEDGG
jgi:Domain of unknown function (DUF4279)